MTFIIWPQFVDTYNFSSQSGFKRWIKHQLIVIIFWTIIVFFPVNHFLLWFYCTTRPLSTRACLLSSSPIFMNYANFFASITLLHLWGFLCELCWIKYHLKLKLNWLWWNYDWNVWPHYPTFIYDGRLLWGNNEKKRPNKCIKITKSVKCITGFYKYHNNW